MGVKLTGLSRRAGLALMLTAAVLAAVGDPGLGVSAEDRSAKNGRAKVLACSDLVIGFDRFSSVHLRTVHNGEVVWAKNAERRFTFDVLSSGSAGGSNGRDGLSMNIATINSDDLPRYFYVEGELSGDRPLRVESKPLGRRVRGQRLYAEASSYYVYLIDTGGRLQRWTVFESNTGAYYYAKPTLVRRGFAGMRTFTWNGAMRINGRVTDLLWGTTRAGALVQVPVAAPRTARVLTVKRRGFADVTGLSANVCNGKTGFASLIAVERRKDRARWFTLRGQDDPRASKLVNRGDVTPEFDWKLFAVS